MDYSLPGSSIHGIFQARILEWVAISFSGRSSQPRDWTRVSCIGGRHFTIWATKEVQRSHRGKRHSALGMWSRPWPWLPKAEGYLVLQGCAELLVQMRLLLHPLLSGPAVLFCQFVEGPLELLQVTGKLPQLRQTRGKPRHAGSKLPEPLLSACWAPGSGRFLLSFQPSSSQMQLIISLTQDY